MEKSVDSIPGIRTRDRRVVAGEESSELLRHIWDSYFLPK